MSQKQQREDQPSTYFITDSTAKKEDIARLQFQDQMITTSMGGVLPEQMEVVPFRRLLDVGCGTGGWLIEAAKHYPQIETLVGVDISSQMVAYARTQAEAQGVSDRVQFQVMDTLRCLEFPGHSFDLVNQRSGVSFIRTWEWSSLLQEFWRVTRPGGVLRLSEGEWGAESSSPALTSLFDLLLQAFYRAGHSFTQRRDGVTSELESLLSRQGCQPVSTQEITTEYRAGTTQGQLFAEDMRVTFRMVLPFLRKWTRVPDDYERWCQQAVQEMLQSDFWAKGKMLTAWGKTRTFL